MFTLKQTLKCSTICFAMLIAPMSHGNKAQDAMFNHFSWITSTFQSMYAPLEWKKQQFNWDASAELDKARATIYDTGTPSTQEYQQLLGDLFYSLRDYHVGFSFYRTERSSLPLTLAEAEGKYFIADVDRTKLPVQAFPFFQGDEVVSFDGKATDEAVKELMTNPINSPLTDKALATAALTRRSSARLTPVEKGPITISIRSQQLEQVFSRQLIWDYQEETIETRPEISKVMAKRPVDYAILNRKMYLNHMSKESGLNRFGLGNRDSYLPPLGEIVSSVGSDFPFQAYVYKNNDGKRIGYVRIPSYVTDNPSAAVQAFYNLITVFQQETDALVIDQLNNPGGSVFYLYALLSTLSNQPLITPKHAMVLTQQDIVEARALLRVTDIIDSDEFARAVFGDSIDGYPMSLQVAHFIRDYAKFLIDEWNAGKTITSPYYIYGVDQINPYAPVTYTKPIVFLVNELDFSGGDFAPAILQDNQRAILMGRKTAGAGGYVLSSSYPNQFGLSRFSYTGSIAYRIDEQPLENLGVTPDVPLQHSANDYRFKFSESIAAINQQVSQLISN